ncbi:uncharacterized protein TNCV_28441 [Trichonephila clavipes]|uniref:Uncharacterized protein n=1 Tax=Trichonephila clavipes TaxID=2585209 RepID=A0A8X6WKY4_TRICX|nr:uncharacterized protein TNCV_28441 [Trichonephila clavipes]
MFGSRSLQLDERRQASTRSFEAWILTFRKVFSESESSYWLLKSEDNGSGKMAAHVGGKLLEKAPTSKDAGLTPPAEGVPNISKYPGHLPDFVCYDGNPRNQGLGGVDGACVNKTLHMALEKEVWAGVVRLTNVKIGEIGNVVEEAVNLTRQINLEVDINDFEELLDPHSQELTIHELIEMHEQEQDI